MAIWNLKGKTLEGVGSPRYLILASAGITNGAFEEGNLLWTGTLSTLSVIDDSKAPIGVKVLKIVPTSLSSMGYASYTVTDGTPIRNRTLFTSLWMKSGRAGGQGCAVCLYDSSVALSTESFFATNEWKLFTGSFSIPANATGNNLSYRIYPVYSVNGVPGHTTELYIDGVEGRFATGDVLMPIPSGESYTWEKETLGKATLPMTDVEYLRGYRFSIKQSWDFLDSFYEQERRRLLNGTIYGIFPHNERRFGVLCFLDKGINVGFPEQKYIGHVGDISFEGAFVYANKPESYDLNTTLGVGLTHTSSKPSNPILQAGSALWEDSGVFGGCLVKSDDYWKLFYTGTSSLTQDAIGAVGFYDFSDTYVRYSTNPIISGSDHYRYPWIEKDPKSDKYNLVCDRHTLAAGTSVISHYTSTNLITFTLSSAVMLSNGYDATGTGTQTTYDTKDVSRPSLIFYDGLWRLWYRSVANDGRIYICHATSNDLVKWSKSSSNPVLATGLASSWMSNDFGRPSILVDNGIYRMFLSGQNVSGIHSIGQFTSQDGLSWSEMTNNPVFTKDSQSWTTSGVSNPYTILYGGALRLIDTSSNQMGYAEVDLWP